jgi:phospholipase C
MIIRCWPLVPILAGLTAAHAQTSWPTLDAIHNIVVIFAENRSFDVLYGSFPGAHGLSQADPASFTQRDRDGSIMKELPPIWHGGRYSACNGSPDGPPAE